MAAATIQICTIRITLFSVEKGRKIILDWWAFKALQTG